MLCKDISTRRYRTGTPISLVATLLYRRVDMGYTSAILAGLR